MLRECLFIFAVAVKRQGKVYRVLVPYVSNLICIFNYCVVVLVSCASFVLIEARCVVTVLFVVLFCFCFVFFSPVVDIDDMFTCKLNENKEKEKKNLKNHDKLDSVKNLIVDAWPCK